MDNPDLCEADVVRALQGLARLNQVSRSARSLWQAIHSYLLSTNRYADSLRTSAGAIKDSRCVRILDVASGSGDNLAMIANLAAKAGVSISLHACDVNPIMVRTTRDNLERAGFSCESFIHDVVQHDLPGEYDVVMSSLFFHHLTFEDAKRVLHRMAIAAEGLVVINDLVRSPSAYFLTWMGSRLFTTSRIVHIDAMRSARAALTVDELHELASEAGLSAPSIRKTFPARMMLTWHSRGTQQNGER